MKVSTLAKNQTIIYTNEATFFNSYGTTIAKTCFEDGVRKVYLDLNSYKYSNTTIKYRNDFLGEDTKTIEKKIKNGEYTLIDLNK